MARDGTPYTSFAIIRPLLKARRRTRLLCVLLLSRGEEIPLSQSRKGSVLHCGDEGENGEKKVGSGG